MKQISFWTGKLTLASPENLYCFVFVIFNVSSVRFWTNYGIHNRRTGSVTISTFIVSHALLERYSSSNSCTVQKELYQQMEVFFFLFCESRVSRSTVTFYFCVESRNLFLRLYNSVTHILHNKWGLRSQFSISTKCENKSGVLLQKLKVACVCLKRHQGKGYGCMLAPSGRRNFCLISCPLTAILLKIIKLLIVAEPLCISNRFICLLNRNRSHSDFEII